MFSSGSNFFRFRCACNLLRVLDGSHFLGGEIQREVAVEAARGTEEKCSKIISSLYHSLLLLYFDFVGYANNTEMFFFVFWWRDFYY